MLIHEEAEFLLLLAPGFICGCHWNILCVFSVLVTPPRSWEWNLALSDKTVTLPGWDTDLKDQKC